MEFTEKKGANRIKIGPQLKKVILILFMGID